MLTSLHIGRDSLITGSLRRFSNKCFFARMSLRCKRSCIFWGSEKTTKLR